MVSGEEKNKICWGCDGNIPIDSKICPYCQLDLYAADTQNGETPYQLNDKTLKETMVPPPVVEKIVKPVENNFSEDVDSSKKTDSLLQRSIQKGNDLSRISDKEWSEVMSGKKEEEQSTIPPRSMDMILFSLISLSVFSLLWGLLQLFFAKNGTLVLSWSTQYWWVYFLGGACSMAVLLRKNPLLKTA